MTDTFYEPIPDEFKENGFLFKRVKLLKGGWEIFKRTANKTGTIHYELIKPYKQEEFTIKGNTIKPKIKYPSTNQFGRLAFCCSSLENAEARYNQVIQTKDEKEHKDEKKLFVPTKPFTIKDLQNDKNNDKWSYSQITLKLKELLEQKKIKVTGEKLNKTGLASKIYSLIK